MARATTVINAPKSKVWEALVNPDAIKRYMFGTDVVSDWKEGGSIVWKGEWEGKKFEDKGILKKIQPEKLLQYSHFSPLSGKPDIPENYHTVTITVNDLDHGVQVNLTQDNNPTPDAVRHSEQNWKMMLEALKEMLEKDQVVHA